MGGQLGHSVVAGDFRVNMTSSISRQLRWVYLAIKGLLYFPTCKAIPVRPTFIPESS